MFSYRKLCSQIVKQRNELVWSTLTRVLQALYIWFMQALGTMTTKSEDTILPQQHAYVDQTNII